MPQTSFSLKSAKQQLTRLLNEIQDLLQDGDAFKDPWQYPTESGEIFRYILYNKAKVRNIIDALASKEQAIQMLYANATSRMEDIKKETMTEGSELECNFDLYWNEKNGDMILDTSAAMRHRLEQRIVELDCQEAASKLDILKFKDRRGTSQLYTELDQPTFGTSHNTHSTSSKT
ncbi:unnamed protein product [Nippostrongylus brasiliensis]|uniref:DUF1738 domain-containing protein n=1 Tax=Nippostrongylus brasiliensis TaxID=27835 RepID=A0A0N4XZZ7_NIPBR|nr:unnamed protein product [Nippostrongylus brasiliensis]